MRSADTDILVLPGYQGSPPEHWQRRWVDKMATAQLIDLPALDQPDLDRWIKSITAAVASASQPVVLVAHSLAVLAIAHAAPKLAGTAVKGAFLVAPAGETAVLSIDAIDTRFVPVPRDPFPFPSVLIASSNDPFCPILEAEEWAYAWGSSFANAGDCGHINVDSGYGPWPEGLMRFAGFLARLSNPV
jgi:uncharacterized protein